MISQRRMQSGQDKTIANVLVFRSMSPFLKRYPQFEVKKIRSLEDEFTTVKRRTILSISCGNDGNIPKFRINNFLVVLFEFDHN